MSNIGLLKGIEQDYLVCILFNGLKEDIKAKVKLYELNTHVGLMLESQMVEEKIRVTSKGGTPSVLGSFMQRIVTYNSPLSHTQTVAKK